MMSEIKVSRLRRRGSREIRHVTAAYFELSPNCVISKVTLEYFRQNKENSSVLLVDETREANKNVHRRKKIGNTKKAMDY